MQREEISDVIIELLFVEVACNISKNSHVILISRYSLLILESNIYVCTISEIFH